MEFPEQFDRFRSTGRPSFFGLYKKNGSNNLKLRQRLEDLLGRLDSETYERLRPQAEIDFESTVNSYLELLSSPSKLIDDPEGDQLPKIDEQSQKEQTNEGTHQCDGASREDRYLGSIQAEIWCTRSGKSLLEYDENLRIERARKTNAPLLFKNKEDFLIRVYNSKNLDVARIREEDSRFMAVLMDSNMARFDATVIFVDPVLRIGSTVTVQLNCYLKYTAFSANQAFPISDDLRLKANIVDESKESNEERFVRLRQQALVIMFKMLGSLADVDKPAYSTADQDGNTTEDEDDVLSQDQLDIFYKEGITSRKDFEPKIETLPPANTFNMELFSYQKRGLTWMLAREEKMTQGDASALDTHPLWTKVCWPEGDFFWVNFNSGELSTTRPTLALSCRGGILADDMGLGKTISTLSMIFTSAAKSSNQCTLIVTPTTLLSQWESEIQKVSREPQGCGCFVYYRTNSSSKTLESSLSQFVKHTKYPVKIVLTTYGMVSSEHKIAQHLRGGASSGLFATSFDRIILDEAHHIKNRNTQAARSCFDLKGARRWALTGTPVVNRLEDMYSLIRFIGVEPWNNFAFWRAFITIKFQNPSTREIAMKTVQAVVSPICLRRTKTMKDPQTGRALVELPKKTVSIQRVQFSEEEKILYSYLYKRVQKSVQSKMQDGTANAKYSAILALLLRLRQVCCHPLMLKKAVTNDHLPISEPSSKRVKFNEEELDATSGIDYDDLKLELNGDIENLLASFSNTPSIKYSSETLKGLLKTPLETQECAICIENHTDPVLTECLHAACRDCMLTHIDFLKKRGENPVCPICRSPISSNRLFYVNYREEKLVPLNSGLQSTKIRALVNALKEASARHMGKSVVFSQFTSFLDLIQLNLKDYGFSVFRFDGSMTPAQRTDAQNRFKDSTDENAVLLLSQKAGGVGLNLVAAKHAYLMDPWWNYASESQAIDRIYRLGQTDNVTITRFIIQGSIEERILKIQEHKRVLSSLVTEEERRAENLENIRILFELDEISNEL